MSTRLVGQPNFSNPPQRGALPAQGNAQQDLQPLFLTIVAQLTPTSGRPIVSKESVVENLSSNPNVMQSIQNYPIDTIREQFNKFANEKSYPPDKRVQVSQVLSALVVPGHVPVGGRVTSAQHVPVGGGHFGTYSPSAPAYVPVSGGHFGAYPLSGPPPGSAHVPVNRGHLPPPGQ